MPLAVAAVHQGQEQVRGHLGGSGPRQELAQAGPGLLDDGSCIARIGYGVLRSRSIDGLHQEVYALLTAYQALIRACDDALTGRPEIPMERISFSVLPAAATDTVTTGQGIFPRTPIDLVGTIGHAARTATRRHQTTGEAPPSILIAVPAVKPA
ncbi:hypothetical protein ACFV2X_07665 [Streptomyces sp. NPDC059679]|uniref:hypothetical protein n=1 Tax=Streptomyces sp. NPDC059679 TaxID=3346903 RepID=UPI0036D019AC